MVEASVIAHIGRDRTWHCLRSVLARPVDVWPASASRPERARAITFVQAACHTATRDQPALDQLGLGLERPRQDDGRLPEHRRSRQRLIRSSRLALLRSIRGRPEPPRAIGQERGCAK